MHNYVLKMFEFLKNMVKFFGILLILFLMLFILYWIQNLTGMNWAWANFSQGFFDLLLECAENLTPKTLNNLNFIFEVKYVVVILFFILVYKINDYLYAFVVKNEEIYIDLRKKFRKIQENHLNKNLEKVQISEQEKIKKFVIYVSTSINDRKTFVKEVNLDEQNKIMNKFLIENLGVLPEVFEQGFLYKFNDFSIIDKKLEVFFKLLNSSAPLNYLIIAHAYQNDFENELLDMKNLISIGLKNQISMNSKTAYRYSFNSETKYRTPQIGIFQKGDMTIEVMNFIEKDL